jgi:nitroreductase
MRKPAATEHPVHDLIRERWSPRAFSDKPISPEILRSLFEAARWAPSSSNEQPWAFLVATKAGKESHSKMLSTLVEFNQTWAQTAPVLAVAVSELAFAKSGQPNRNAFYDTGAAVSQLTAEATHRGLLVHQMAGFEPAKVVEHFGVPAGWQPIAAITIGYPGDTESLPEKLRERELAPRERKPLTEFVMGARWGEPASFLKK